MSNSSTSPKVKIDPASGIPIGPSSPETQAWIASNGSPVKPSTAGETLAKTPSTIPVSASDPGTKAWLAAHGGSAVTAPHSPEPTAESVTETAAEPHSNPFYFGDTSLAPKAQLTSYQNGQQDIDLRKATSEQNNLPFLTKSNKYLQASWEGGFFQSTKDLATDSWNAVVSREAGYDPSIEEIQAQSGNSLSRDELYKVKNRTTSQAQTDDLLERLKDYKDAQRVLSMADGWGNVVAFGGQLVDGLPVALVTSGGVGTLANALRVGAATRAALAVGVNASVGAGQEYYQSVIGMRDVNIGDLAATAAMSGVLGIMDMNSGKLKGSKVLMGDAAKADASKSLGQAAEGTIPGVTQAVSGTPVRNSLAQVVKDGVTQLVHAGSGVVDYILKREGLGAISAKIVAAKEAIKAAVNDGADIVSTHVLSQTLEKEIADSLGIPEYKEGFLQKLGPDAATEYLHGLTLADIKKSPLAKDIMDHIGGAELESKTRFTQLSSEGTRIDAFSEVSVNDHGLVASESLSKAEPTIEVYGSRIGLDYDNPVDKALFVASHGTTEEIADATKWLGENLKGLTPEEIQQAIKETGGISPHLEWTIASSGRAEIAAGGHNMVMRVPDGSEHLVQVSKGRISASEASKVPGLSYENSVHGEDLKGAIGDKLPGTKVETGPVIAVDENGNLQGHWDSKSPDKDATLWKKTTAIVKAASAFNKKDVKAWFEGNGFAEHYQAVMSKVENFPKVSERLVKRLVSEEIYSKGIGMPAKLGIGMAVIAGAAQAQDSGSIEDSKNPLMLAGIFMGAHGAMNLKGTPHEHIYQAHQEAQALHSKGIDMEEIRMKTGWFQHPVDNQWRYEVSTHDSYSMDLEKALKNAKGSVGVNHVGEKFLRDNQADLKYLEDMGVVKKAQMTKYLRQGDDWYLPQIVHQLKLHYSDSAQMAEVASRLESHLKDPELPASRKAYQDAPRPSISLAQFVDNDVLATAYPEFEKVRVSGSKAENTLGSVSSDGVNQKVTISTAGGKEQARSTGTHETQHVIQRTEGFPEGTNPIAAGGYDNYRKTGGEVEARNAQARRDMTPEQLKASNPLSTMDVPLSEIIVKAASGTENNLSLSYSDTPVAKAIEGFPEAKVVRSGGGAEEPRKATGGIQEKDIKYQDDAASKTSEIIDGKKVYTGNLQHLNLGVLRSSAIAAESLQHENVGDVFLSKVQLKGHTIRTGFSVADITGSSESGLTRYMQSEFGSSVPGRQGGTATGDRMALNKTTADVYKRLFMERHLGPAITGSEELFMQKAKEEGIGWFSRNYNRKLVKDFHEEVTKTYRGIPSQDKFVNQAVDLYRKQMRAAYDETMSIMKLLPEELPPDSLYQAFRDINFHDNYVPRMWDAGKLMDIVSKVKDIKGLYRVFSDAFVYEDGFKPTQEIREQSAKELVDFLIVLKNDPKIGNSAQASVHEAIAAAKENGISDATLANYLSFGGVDASRFVSGRLKARISMDELSQGINLEMKAGGTQQVAISDLLVNDARAVFGNWINMSSGMYSMGLKSIESGYDYSSNSFWETAFKQMSVEGATEKEKTYIKELRNHVMAAGQTSTIMREESQAGKLLRNLTILKNSTGFIFSTPSEMMYSKTLRVFGGSGILRFITDFAHITQTGRLKGDFARDLQYGMAAGLTGLTPALTNFMEHGFMETADGFLGRAINQKMHMAGFAQLNAWQQSVIQGLHVGRIAEYALMKDHLNKTGAELSLGGTRLRGISAGEWERLRSFGIDKDLLDSMTPHLKEHIKFASDGEVIGIDWKALSSKSPVGTAKIQGALFRIGKDATTDEAGIAETIPFMTGDFGKTIFQFQQVTARSMQKAKKSLLIRDPEEVQRIMLSFMGGAFGHILKTYIMFGNDQQERDKRLTPGSIFATAFRNMALSGPLPAMVSLASSTVLGFDPLADAGNTDKKSRTSVAAADTINQITGNIHDGFQNLWDSNNSVSQQGIKETMKLTPAGPWLMPMAALGMDAMGIQQRDPIPKKAKAASGWWDTPITK